MTVKISGNHNAGFGGKDSFAGAGSKVIPFAWAAVTAEAGDVAILEAAHLPIKYGAVNIGIYFQSEVPVDVDFTLCHPENAMDPDPAIQEGVMWSAGKVLAAAEIWGQFMVFTAIRIKFNGKGTCYVGCM